MNLQELPGVICYIDDILVSRRTEEGAVLQTRGSAEKTKELWVESKEKQVCISERVSGVFRP